MKSNNQFRNCFYRIVLFLLLAMGLLGCNDPLVIPTIPPTIPPAAVIVETPPVLELLPTPPNAPLEEDPLSNDFSDYQILAGSTEIIEPPALTTPQDTALAVVRIRGCDASGNCIDTNQGSGAIIHPNGIILTAWHVTVLDPRNQALPDFYDHFLIEITDDVSSPPQPGYYARWIAYNTQDDLALLRIVGEYGQPLPDDWGQMAADLPWLPISNDERPAQSDLWVMGYPPTVSTVDYRSYRYSGLESSTIRIPDAIPKGFSGGPTLVQKEGSYEIVGVVSSRVQDVAFIRNVQQLENLIWLPKAQMWAENVQIVPTVFEGKLQSQLEITVHTLGYRATAFDLQADLLLISDNQEQKAQQKLLSANFVNIQQLSIPLDQSSKLFNRPLFVSIFRLSEREVWRVEAWIMPKIIQLATTSSPTTTYTPMATRPPAIPAPTLTAAAQATRIAMAVAATEAAKPTATPTHTSHLYQTATAEAQEIDLAVAATLAAKASTATLIPLESIDTAIPSKPTDTSTVTPTPTSTDTTIPPTSTLIPPTPTDTSTVTPTPTSTDTAIPPTSTLIPPTPTDTSTVTPTPTSTDTTIPPTSTLIPPTPTDISTVTPTPTYTSIQPTSTPIDTSTVTPTLVSAYTTIPQASNDTQTQILDINSTYINPVDGASYVYVPAGEFIMGSSGEQINHAFELCTTYHGDCQRSWYENEQPQHTIYLESYWIMQTEVTNAQYQKFIDEGGYTTEIYWSTKGWIWRTDNNVNEPDSEWKSNNFNGPDQPIIDVSWYEAEAYANWISAETELNFSLPTEAQWEKAARGTDGRNFPWGNQWDSSRTNYCDKNCTQDWADKENNDGYQYTAPVGSYPTGASLYGVLDMVGNVWEWTANWYSNGYDVLSPSNNPTGPENGDSRIVRGGSWNADPAYVRTAVRGKWYTPNYRLGYIGFRLVRHDTAREN